MQLIIDGSQIVFTTVASNTYAINILRQVEAGFVRKKYILLLRTPVTVFLCVLQSGGLVISVRRNRCYDMRASSPILQRWSRAVHADSFTFVVVLQHRLHTKRSCKVRYVYTNEITDIKCCCHITWHSIRSSLHMTLFCPLGPQTHTYVAAFPVLAKIPQYDISTSRISIICPI